MILLQLRELLSRVDRWTSVSVKDGIGLLWRLRVNI